MAHARDLREQAQRLVVRRLDSRVDALASDPLEQVTCGRGTCFERDALAPVVGVEDDSELELVRIDAAVRADRMHLDEADRLALEQDQPGAEAPLAPADDAAFDLSRHPLARQRLLRVRRSDDRRRVADGEHRVDVVLAHRPEHEPLRAELHYFERSRKRLTAPWASSPSIESASQS